MRSVWMACVLAVAACGPRPVAEAPAPPDGPGRFPHSAIWPTPGPADGPATLLVLAETPFDQKPTGPYIHIGLHGFPRKWSGKTVRIEPGQLGSGWATLWANDDGQALRAAAVTFGRVADGEPVEGEYDLILPDGTPARGRFRAEQRKHRPGGARD